MPRYIDADEFIKRVIRYPRQSTKTIGLAIADTPTADVVEVVRCKDCRKWCIHHSDDYFCADGERKETEDVGKSDTDDNR